MNKKVIAIVVAVVVLIGGAFTFVGLNNAAMRADSMDSVGPDATQSDTATGTNDPDGTIATGTGVYTEYTPAAVAAATGTTVLFFHAPWCPQCVALDRDITQRGAPDGWTILKIDYDSSTALKQRYGVTFQTTMVFVDANGDALAKEIVYDEPTLASVVAAAP